MPERTLFHERGVLVTTGRLVANGSTYAIRNVDSVRVIVQNSDQRTKNALSKNQSQFKTTYLRFISLGLMPVCGVMLGLLGGGWNWLWLPVCLAAAFLSQTLVPALNAANLHRLQHPYVCMIRLSGRDVEAFRSDDEEFTRRVANALGDALVETAG